jgi:hypothetical protein
MLLLEIKIFSSQKETEANETEANATCTGQDSFYMIHNAQDNTDN